MATVINRAHLKKLRAIEDARFLDTHKKSAQEFERSKKVMHEGVPMSWMAKWPGDHAVFVKSAKVRTLKISMETHISISV
jgi:glutamate-1-semialdehyde 2,1-aminomutase